MGFQDETVAFGGIAIGGRDVILHAPPIGSGVAVIVYDPELTVGGIAHMPHPERGAKLASDSDHRIESLFNLLVAAGGDVGRARAVIVGGAGHFEPAFGPLAEFANRSLERTRKDLKEAGLAEVLEDVGGRFARTCVLEVEKGRVTISAASGGETVFVIGQMKVNGESSSRTTEVGRDGSKQ